MAGATLRPFGSEISVLAECTGWTRARGDLPRQLRAGRSHVAHRLGLLGTSSPGITIANTSHTTYECLPQHARRGHDLGCSQASDFGSPLPCEKLPITYAFALLCRNPLRRHLVEGVAGSAARDDVDVDG